MCGRGEKCMKQLCEETSKEEATWKNVLKNGMCEHGLDLSGSEERPVARCCELVNGVKKKLLCCL
jgi:hypothetical protein